MRDSEAPDLEDDVYAAAAKGFRVVYDKAGTKDEFLQALYDPSCYGIYWSGHGAMDGTVQTSDGKWVGPGDIDATKVSPSTRYLILAACGSGIAAKAWQAVLGPRCRFEGWVDVTTTAQTRDFTSSSWLFDSLTSHGGMHPEMELEDYIELAEKAK